MYGLPPNSRKPRGHKVWNWICPLSLSYDSGRSSRVSVDLAIFYHDTLKAYLPPKWWKRRPRDNKWATKPNHPPLLSFRPPPPCSNVQILKPPTPTYSQRSCDRVNGDLSASILFDSFVINYLEKLSWSTNAWTIQPDWNLQFSPQSVENKLRMPA